MFKLGDSIVWSASDLTLAATCEYALLRTLDRKLGRSPAPELVEDPLLDQLAVLGNLHEQRELERLQDLHGLHSPGSGSGVVTIDRVRPTYDGLMTLADETRQAFESGADVVFQAGFFDGEFQGYADFVRRTPAGWVVSDTKLARRAKTTVLLQIAAYADQLARWQLPVAPTAELILGSGNTVAFPLSDIAPVFRERRERLRELIRAHAAQPDPVGWNATGVACGRCADCALAIADHEDLLLVAGLRMEQRKKLWAAGIHTVTALAGATEAAEKMSARSFDTLRAQATLQVRQMRAEKADSPDHFHDVFDLAPLRALPDPSTGDLFFDFEGDPMFHPDTSDRWGLEYLWESCAPADRMGRWVTSGRSGPMTTQPNGRLWSPSWTRWPRSVRATPTCTSTTTRPTR